MGNLKQRLVKLALRVISEVVIDGLGKIHLRPHSWQEERALQSVDTPEGVDESAWHQFLAVAVTVLDPQDNSRIFEPSADGFAEFSKLPGPIARRLVAEVGKLHLDANKFTEVDPVTKKKQSGRKRGSRTLSPKR